MAEYRFNLQLFAGEKTEPATPRRREEARKKGQVAKSAEVSTAFLVLTGFLLLRGVGPFVARHLRETVQFFLANLHQWQGDLPGLGSLLLVGAAKFGLVVAPIFLAFFAISLLSQVIQVGFVVSSEVLQPKFSRINPLEGLRRIFSKRALVEFLKSAAKVALVGYLVYKQVAGNITWLRHAGLFELEQGIALVVDEIYRLGLQVGLLLMVVAAADYWWQRREFETSIRMSKEEIKEEFKQMEGDPLVRSRIRQRQRQIAAQRMMQAVPTADVVVTNPTHYAVAIKYTPGQMDAPQVVAKGRGLIAQRIKEEAQKHRITTIQNPELARALYATTEVGQEIPAHLYPAVAEVLAFVYRLRKKSV